MCEHASQAFTFASLSSAHITYVDSCFNAIGSSSQKLCLWLEEQTDPVV